ncbi:MAG: tetratricopeptide repeat protein [Candidatus Thermoplasmatota archaeon]
MLETKFDLDLVDRESEFRELREEYRNAKEENGSTVFVSGEAGIGKTRLVKELIKKAEDDDAKIIEGRCLPENLEPLMPMKEALREADLYHLVSGDPPPKILSVYLMKKESGLLISKAEREETGLDADIFAPMLTSVESFVKDSLQEMGRSGESGLNTIGYDKYTILEQSKDDLSLAVVIDGTKTEFLIDDMKETLADIGDRFEDWEGDMKETREAKSKLDHFIESGKYDGEHLVEDPKVKKENLFDHILMGLQRLSIERPVVLFIDDLQWADPSTLSLLHHLSWDIQDDKILLVGTYRPEDIVDVDGKDIHPLKKTLRNMLRDDLYREIELERLEVDQVEDFIQKSLGETDFEEKFVHHVHRESEGNPFFLLELIKLLTDEGHIKKKEGVWKLEKPLDDISIPDKIYNVVARRLDRLVEEQRDLLEYASVVGENFQSNVIGRATSLERVKVLKNLSKLEKVHKLVHSLGERYEFDHSKIREVLYNDINDELREEYHRIIAESYENLYEDEIEKVVGEIANHYMKADDVRAVKYLLMAGRKARAQYAIDEAKDFYNEALSMAETDEQKMDAYRGLGDVHDTSGNLKEAIDDYRSALERGSDEREKIKLYRKTAQVYLKIGDYEDSIERVHDAYELLKDQKNIERLRLLGIEGLAELYKGHFDEAGDIFEEEQDLARRLDEDSAKSRALYHLGVKAVTVGEFDRAVEKLEEAKELAEREENNQELCKHLNKLGDAYYHKGELDKAESYYQDGLELSEKIRDKNEISLYYNDLGRVKRRRGEFENAFEDLQKAKDMLEKMGDRDDLAETLGHLGFVHQERGELEEALERFKRKEEIEKTIGNDEGQAKATIRIAEVLRMKGQLERALERLETAKDTLANMGDKDDYAESIYQMAMVYHNQGELDYALGLLEESYDICDRIDQHWGLIYIANEFAEVHAEKGELKKGLEHVDRALERALESGAKNEECMVRLTKGMILSNKGDIEKAEEQLKEAKTLAEKMDKKVSLARFNYIYAKLQKNRGNIDIFEKKMSEALEQFGSMGMESWARRCRDAVEAE